MDITILYKNPRLHGLFIGIDKYKNTMHGDLRGSVNDAESMLKYFTDSLGVPSSHLRCLFNEEATRDNIVETFISHLVDNQAIQRFDPIVVYFAGHGATCSALVEWGSGVVQGDIEILVTHDADTFDANGEYIFGIPDKALGELVYHLSQAKGNNITVILDSCHSGSGTRGSGTRSQGTDLEVQVRSSSVPDAPTMPVNHYEYKIKELFPEGPSEIGQATLSKWSSQRLLAPGLDTHTLLAACRQDEQAFEAGRGPTRGGVFTRALLASLQLCNPSMTGYSTLMRSILKNLKLSPYKQIPQCEGRNQDRLLFSLHLSTSKGKIALLPMEDEGIFRIEVGSAVGIVVGTEFGVFLDGKDNTPAPIAQLVATDVGPTGALLKGQESPNSLLKPPDNAYVTVIKYNNHSNSVRVQVPEKSALPKPWKEVFENLASQPVIWTKPGEASDLILVPTQDGVELQRNTHSLEQPGPAHIQLKHELGANRLSHILAGAIRFHFYLQQQNPETPIQAKLGMKLQELEEIGSKRWGIPQYKPTGEDLFAGCLTNGTVTSVQADAKKLFGLTLTNNSDQGLFPYVLYYNLEDYSISCLYDPPSRSMTAPLPAATDDAPGSLSIGYGTGGSRALNVELTNPASRREYGVFVLLVFDKWVDVSYLQQGSLFEHVLARGPIQTKGFGPAPVHSPPASLQISRLNNIWDKISVRVAIVP